MNTGTAYRIAKRAFDIAASGAAMLLLMPVWSIAMIGIEISDFGPVFYLAKRAGKNNEPFTMLKFRSMRIDNKEDERSLRPNQERIFPFGHLMRRTKVDEIPQLVNVLFGDMSIVGPRPAAIDQISITRGADNAMVAEVKPGLTSPAAIYDYLYGDTIIDEEEYMEKVAPTRLALDRYYINNQSISYDMKMIWYTLRCIGGSVTGKIPMDILEEMITAVKGDRDTLTEVK